jgi:hypothetical protein
VSATNQIILTTPDATAVQASSTEIVEAAKAMTIGSKDEHGQALGLLADLKKSKRGVEALFAESKAAANAAHKAITGLERKLVAPIDDAIGILTPRISGWETEQYHLARRAEEEARAAAIKQEEDRILEDAAAAEKAGDKALAAEIIAQPVEAPMVTVAPDTAKLAGVTGRVTWSAEVTDLMALIRHVAAHPDLLHLLMPSMVSLNAMARAQKEALKLPGVRPVSSRNYSVSR